jgi:hypothetical protein
MLEGIIYQADRLLPNISCALGSSLNTTLWLFSTITRFLPELNVLRPDVESGLHLQRKGLCQAPATEGLGESDLSNLP